MAATATNAIMEGAGIRRRALLLAAGTFSGRGDSENTVATGKAWHGSSGMQAKISIDFTHPTPYQSPRLSIVTTLRGA
jgi:hypothetical protein